MPGDVVVQGHWLHRTRRADHLRFYEVPEKLATAHAHSVRKVDVMMEQIDTTNADSDEEEDLILIERNRILFQLTEGMHDDIVDSVATQRRL